MRGMLAQVCSLWPRCPCGIQGRLPHLPTRVPPHSAGQPWENWPQAAPPPTGHCPQQGDLCPPSRPAKAPTMCGPHGGAGQGAVVPDF